MHKKIESDLRGGLETVWINPFYLPFETTNALCELIISEEAIADATERLIRFAPFIRKKFPETEASDGLIESALVDIPNMQHMLETAFACKVPGRLLLKMDSHLAIAGSVKARGGIYEVLKYAETLAFANGILKPGDSYERFAEEDVRTFLSQYTIQVGSTGNLGMSIGIISAALGFRVIIHMSADAKQWKKELLRNRGAEVVEYKSDYSKAVEEGRKNALSDTNSYFVDDERSKDLFLGYAVAAGRLQKQLAEKRISVDADHPLIVYIPAGVGGAPGGISYGLKRIFKDNVHCFFVEPTQCPSVLLGIATQKFEKANVRDYGISGKTDADGLACPSPSSLVTRIMTNLVSGDFTVSDGHLYDFLRLLNQSQNMYIEPSSCSAFIGPVSLLGNQDSAMYLEEQGLTPEKLEHATQIVWATGGNFVPEAIRREHLETYI